MDSVEIGFMCQKIVKDLYDILEDKDIYEISYVPSEEQCNKSPILFEENCLGIETWCIPHLFKHSYLEMFPRNFQYTKPQNDDQIEKQSRVLLFLQPDLVTVWNIRRKLVIRNFLKIVDELKFSELVLQLKPKSASTFNYREWLLKNSSLYESSSEPLSEEIIQHELDLTLRCSQKYDRNYYAWSHRSWIIEQLTHKYSNEQLLSIICKDLNKTKNYLEENISDYSCCNYRHFLLKFINKKLQIEEHYWNLLMNELQFIDEMLKIYHKQESLILHRRAVLSFIFQFRPYSTNLCKTVQITLSKINRNDLNLFPTKSFDFL